MRDHHVYHRTVTTGSGDSLAKIAERIAPDSSVLDVGTGTGALGHFLGTQRGCLVDGVNNSAAELEIASPHYRETFLCNLEEVSLSELLRERKYDYIIFADVLEHLRDPARVLKDAARLLASEGRVLISLPNIGHAGVVASLLAGEFNYTREGILDDTHVRFFTRSSLLSLLASCALKPIAWDAVVRPLAETEFRHRYPDAFTPALARALTTHPDALIYQFIVDAVDERSRVAIASNPEPLPPEVTFIAQLYFARVDARFSEEMSSRAVGRIGRLQQTLTFPIALDGVIKLRLDPADRPGTLRLWSLRIVDSTGEVLWEWNGRPDGFSSSAHVVAVANGFGRRGTTLGLLSNDPSLGLTLEDVSLPSGCRLECELDWPTSTDTLALSQVLLEWNSHLERSQLGGPSGARASLLEGEPDPFRLVDLLENVQRRETALTRRIKSLEIELAARSGASDDAPLLPANEGEGAVSIHFFTSVAANYIPKARVLASAVKRHNPRARFHLLLADERPAWLGAEAEPFDSVILARDLGIDDFERWVFKHSVVELCTAVKGFGFRYIIERLGAEKVVYLDPDMVVLASLKPLERILDHASILLTPHVTVPEESDDAIADNEIGSLKHGVFNLGFLAVRSSPEGKRFVDWWAARLRDYCYDDIPGGLFTDQRWVDLAPCFFEDIFVLRDPSYNVATWNLTHREVTGSMRDGVLVNGRPLRVYHFSGFDSGAQEAMLKKYGGRNTALFELRSWYIAECEAMGQEAFGKTPYAYGLYSDGRRIEQRHRITYRLRADLMETFPHPSRVDDPARSYRHWFAAHVVSRRERGLQALTRAKTELSQLVKRWGGD